MHIWELLIDYLFPPSPEELIVRDATIEDMKREYCPSQKNNVSFFSNYQRKLIKAAIKTAKFSHNKKAVNLLATLLTLWLDEHKVVKTLLIPIPLHPKRERERGYNQVTRVLKRVPFSKTIIAKNILSRNRHTTPQSSLPKSERNKNMVGAFTINLSQLNKYLTPEIKRVIICDDVYTTGSTLKEAKKMLASYIPKDCELICLAWAH